MMWSSCVEEERPGRGEDRVAAFTFPDRVIAIVVDGAGGTSGGARAADAVCEAFRGVTQDTPAWVEWLKILDQQLAASPSCGLAAVAVVEIRQDGMISGASVGDCEAWVFGHEGPVNLTVAQVRKPLLGSGEARPVAFSARLSGTLVAGTDGLWKYAARSKIRDAAEVRPLEAAVTALVDGVRLRSGKLQDDVGVLVLEAT